MTGATTSKALSLVVIVLVVVGLLATGPVQAEDHPDGLGRATETSVVFGDDGDMFFDVEFEKFCEWRGAKLERGMRRLTRLSDAIAASGRRVVFTVAPAKSVIVRENVRWSESPGADCAKSGMREQLRVLDDYEGAHYLSMLRRLDRDSRQTYWKSDGHWTTVGAENWVQLLARELDPDLPGLQRYSYGTETDVGALALMLGLDIPETVPTAEYAGPVRVTTDPDSAYDLDPSVVWPLDHSWNSKPRRLTWPGHTLLIGDSFTLMALDTLRPLFRHGRYLWTGNVAEEVMADAIREADTVVIEVVQFYTYGSLLGTKSFRKLVRRELKRD